MDSEKTGIPATMLVGPANAGGYPMYNNGGFGGFGGDWSWILLLILLCGGGWGGGFGGMMGGFGGMYEFPWLLNGQNQINANTNSGFDHAATQSSLGNLSTAITSGFGDVQLGIAGVNQNICQTGNGIQNALCQGFAGTTAAVTAAQNGVTQQLYNNEIASLNRSFAEQTANTAGFTSVNTGVADLKYTVATEACADRAAISDALKDVIAANTASTQRILDQLCSDKIEAKNNEIANLRQQLNMAQLAASQTAQNAFIAQGFSNEVDQLYNRLNTCPVPTTPVYGRTPIFTCNGNSGCGCGNGFVN